MAETNPTTRAPAAAPAVVPLEAELDDWDDGDSALEVGSISSSTTSLSESILKYREDNGRTFHAYKDGKYMFPNDEAENDRLDLQHHLCTLTWDSKLHLCPAGKENKLHRVLDMGTGTGIWAIDFADEHPEAEIIGVDLSAIQPAFIPPNLRFEVDDLEEDWTYSKKFDFIYGRNLLGSFTNWPRIVEQAYQNLNPGGFIELFDPYYPVLTDDNTFPPNSALERWSTLALQVFHSRGADLDQAKNYKKYLEAAGFVNIVQREFRWPLNRWPKDKKLKELGMWCNENVAGGLEGISVATFTRVLRWSEAVVSGQGGG